MTDPRSQPATKLLPCPFCEGEAVRIGPYGGEGLFGVQCLQCNAGVRGYDQCEQDAVEAWNTRSAPARCDAPVAWRWRIKDAAGNVSAWEISNSDPKISRMVLHDCEPLYAAPRSHSDAEVRDVRWAVNVLLEKIAAKFEGWDTYDIWRSDAAATVRSFKHALATPPALPAREEVRRASWIDQNYQIDRYGVALMMIREGCADPAGLARRILSEFEFALSPSSNGGEEDLVQRTASDASPPRSHPGNGD